VAIPLPVGYLTLMDETKMKKRMMQSMDQFQKAFVQLQK
jgi:hypothetical protein